MLTRSATARAALSAVIACGLPLGATALTAQGCGGGIMGNEGGGSPDGGAKDAAPPTTTTLHPDAAALPGEAECTVVVTTGIPVASASHLPTCTPIKYSTNPPSGGNHWGIWATYTEYTAPVPREMYTHNLEHGGVVLSYRCQGPCPEIKAALEEAQKGATDPFCVTNGPPATRVVLTPDPDLPTPIAASAWGATYTATCIDKASLGAFIATRIGHGTEMLCADGVDPAPVVAGCPDGG